MQGDLQPAYEFGAFRLDVAEQRLLCAGRPLPLTPKVFDVLRVLVQNHGHLVEKERLLAEVWPDSFVEEGALSRSISILRKTAGRKRFGSEIHRDGAQARVSLCRGGCGARGKVVTADSTGRHQSLTLPSSRLSR
jgi:hypothetical protein